MFSKNKISDTDAKSAEASRSPSTTPTSSDRGTGSGSAAGATATGIGAPKPKASPSLLSTDLMVKGNVMTTGDIQIEGTVEGDVRAHLLTVGESATIRGEVIADDVVVNGRVIGRLRGLKVRLTATSQVEGDIVHKTIAIESGAHFEGSVQRHEDPLGDGTGASGGQPTTVAGGSSGASPSSSGFGSSGGTGSGQDGKTADSTAAE